MHEEILLFEFGLRFKIELSSFFSFPKSDFSDSFFFSEWLNLEAALKIKSIFF